MNKKSPTIVASLSLYDIALNITIIQLSIFLSDLDGQASLVLVLFTTKFPMMGLLLQLLLLRSDQISLHYFLNVLNIGLHQKIKEFGWLF